MTHINLTAILSTMCLSLAMISTSCVTPRPEDEVRATFYVAPEGNDDWDGTAPAHHGDHVGPFRTLRRAQEAVRRHPEKGRHPILVALRQGTYRLTAPWTFTPLDSGTPEAPVTWTAFPGEQPVISGGKAITGWKVNGDGSWSVTIPQAARAHSREDGWDISQLFVNGRRRPRARLPKAPHFFRMDGRPESWQDLDQARTLRHACDQIVQRQEDMKACFLDPKGNLRRQEIQNAVAVLYNAWTASTHHVLDVNPQSRRITLTMGGYWPVGYWEPEGRYHLENLRCALTDPGEWHLDYGTGTLTYLPMPGEDPEETTVIAPVTGTILMLLGDAEAGLPVSNLVFRGLSVMHAAFSLPFDRCEDGQAAALQRGAVRTEAARQCIFEDMLVAHVGGYGMDLGKGSCHNVIRRCEITDMGAGGVRIGETVAEPHHAIACAHNTLENSLIHDGGHIAAAGVGALVLRSSYNTIRHNEICDLFYSAVSVGWSWGYDDSSAHHNVVEYNRLHHLGYGVLSDLGGVYTLGISPGTVVRGNTVHDVHAYSYGGWGLYADEGSSGILWEDNLVYRTKSGAFFQHYGRENILRHNILAFAQEGLIGIQRQESHVSLTCEDNLAILDNGRPYSSGMARAKTIARNNIYWDVTGQPFGFNLTSLKDCQEEGLERGSVIADPRCRNPQRMDFTLLPDSPALAVATPALEAAKIAGLFGSPQWTGKAHRLTYKAINPHALPVTLTRPPIIPTTDLQIDFKDCRKGALSPWGTTFGEDSALGTAIRVTDEIHGPGSRNALHFIDAPGQPHDWQPHVSYPVNWRKGTVIGDFDVYLNSPDAILWHEWRDASDPSRVGPALRLEGSGNLLWGQTRIGAVPLKTWIHVRLKATLGQDQIAVAVTPRGKPTQTATLKRISPDWDTANLILFISASTRRSDFYVANISFRRLPEGARD